MISSHSYTFCCGTHTLTLLLQCVYTEDLGMRLVVSCERGYYYCSLVLRWAYWLVLQATPFAERGRVWSRYTYQVVALVKTFCDQ